MYTHIDIARYVEFSLYSVRLSLSLMIIQMQC